MQLIDEGVEHLVEERSKPAGLAREATLLAALHVLVTALQTDVWLLQELRQFPSTGTALCQFINQSTNQVVSQSIGHSIIQSINQSSNFEISQSLI